MKRLLTLIMLLPVLCHAQLVEFSLKGGALTNRMLQQNLNMNVKNPIGYAGSFAATVSFPGAVRLGFAVSAYDVRTEVTSTMYYINGNNIIPVTVTKYTNYGDPLVPVEALLIKRFNPGRLRIDVGGSVGTLLNRTVAVDYDHDIFPATETTDKKYKWRTYGALLGVQYRLGWRSGIGFEVQPKWLKINGNQPAFAMPVMAKYCFYII